MIQRVFIFTCDDCGEKTQKESYGFPANWRATAPIFGQKLKQVCPICSKNYKEDRLLDKNGKSQYKFH